MKLTVKILKIAFAVALGILLLNLVFSGFVFGILTWSNLGRILFYSLVLTLLNAGYFSIFNKKIGWEDAKLPRVLLASGGSVVLTLLGFFFCRMADVTLFQGHRLQEFLQNERPQYYLFPLLVTIIISLAFHLVYFYRALQEQRVREQKIIAGTASAKFESLKNQLDPHFLFNSLNVLSSLIEENPEQAQRFTTSLSKIYRYVLEQKDKELVGLQEELRFAGTFMKLLEMRFENSIFFELPKSLSTPEAKVVPLSLQLLLENCIKHNVVSENRPLKIRIYEAESFLVIENNLQPKEVLSHRKGVGLQNIVRRYGLVTRRKVLVEEGPELFRVKLPILTEQINILATTDKNTDRAYLKARERVKELKEFYGHLISYCVVIPCLAFLNWYTYWDYQWFWFPLLGWGVGLTLHAFSTFGYGGLGKNWEERKIQELMEKEEQEQNTWK